MTIPMPWQRQAPIAGREAAPASEVTDLALSAQPDRSWPEPLNDDTRAGILGDFLATVAPNTEADEAALAFQFIVGARCLLGRESYVAVEADRHTPNEFLALVQDTGTGKGVAWGHVRWVIAAVDPAWTTEHIVSGLSTGEGLINELRDADPVEDDDKGDGTSPRATTDKRLLVQEPELGRVLQVMARENATLSAILRQSWDAGNLRVMTRKDPLRATGVHVALIGHIIGIELHRLIGVTDLCSGWGNRFMWVVAKRARLLPRGGHVDPRRLDTIARTLQAARRRAQAGGEVRFEVQAERDWDEVYPELTRPTPGVYGAVRDRGRAHVLRLCLILALLDQSRAILPRHLAGALELWRYAEDSAWYLFGNLTGDRVGDEVLAELRANPTGLTRTDIRDLFNRHRSASQIGQALALLHASGLAQMEKQGTGGRSAERWFATREACDQSDKSDQRVGP